MNRRGFLRFLGVGAVTAPALFASAPTPNPRPKLAQGGVLSPQSGFIPIGENGPELVCIPRGQQVITGTVPKTINITVHGDMGVDHASIARAMTDAFSKGTVDAYKRGRGRTS